MAMKTRVLFLCTENSCRTQMAEAFLRELTGDELEIVSAGSEAGRLDPCGLDSPAALEAHGMSHAMAVRYARDKIRRHVADFVAEHHHSKSGKRKSTWT